VGVSRCRGVVAGWGCSGLWRLPAWLPRYGRAQLCSLVCAPQAVHLAPYGVAIPQESQIRAAPVQPVQVRGGVFHRWQWLPRGPGCQGQIVHGGLHPRHRPLQPDILQPGWSGGRQCRSRARRGVKARQSGPCRGNPGAGVRCGRSGDTLSVGCALHSARSAARAPASDDGPSSAAGFPCEAAARAPAPAPAR
jgi:hypothetical protein